jgi:hypothetical protein
MVDSIDNINKFVGKLRVEDIEELVRRDSIAVDSNAPSGSSFAVARSGGMPSSSSVERAVISRVEGRKVSDPVRDEVRAIERSIIQAEENMRRIIAGIKNLNDTVEKKRTRQPSEPCEICVVLPAVKTAMCIGCYQEWVENGAPDRFRWKAYKRQMLSSDGKILVEDPPPPRR